MFRSIVFLTLLALLPGLLYAQEKPSRDRRDRTEKPSEQKDPKEQQADRAPRNAQEKAIEDTWMKELRGERTEPAGINERNAPTDAAGESPAAPAQGNPTEGNATETAQPGAIFAEDAAPSFIGLLFRFVLIAGLMGGGLYFFVRFFKKRVGILQPQEGPVEVLASVPLMPGKFLQIVDLAGQLLVLGVSEQGVRLVYEIESSTTAERIRLWHQSRPRPTATSLLDAVQKSIKQGEFKFWGGERVKDRPDFMDLLNGEKASDDVAPDRLKDLLELQNRKLRRSTKAEDNEPL